MGIQLYAHEIQQMKYIASKNVRLILKLFFANPERRYYFREIAGFLDKKAGVLQKALNYLVREKILLDERRGNLRFFFVNKMHPLYQELRRIVFKTVGVEGSLKEVLSKVKGIQFAFLYGSFAKDVFDSISDVDLCVIGDAVNMKKMNAVLAKEEKAFQREINFVLYSVNEFEKKKQEGDPFVSDILKGAVFLIGSCDEFIKKT
jgi:predicted nucleotidyltransferase